MTPSYRQQACPARVQGGRRKTHQAHVVNMRQTHVQENTVRKNTHAHLTHAHVHWRVCVVCVCVCVCVCAR